LKASKFRAGAQDKYGIKEEAKPQKQKEPVETRFQPKFSVVAQTMEQINRAKVLMASDGHGPSLDELFKACLGVYLEKHDPKERALRRKKRAEPFTGCLKSFITLQPDGRGGRRDFSSATTASSVLNQAVVKLLQVLA
jgi:hypothetical protein